MNPLLFEIIFVLFVGYIISLTFKPKLVKEAINFFKNNKKDLIDHEKDILLATLNSEIEASLLSIELNSHGIETKIGKSNLVNWNPLYSNAIGGIKVYVSKTNLNKAKNIITHSNTKVITCPNCESHNCNKNNFEMPFYVLAIFMLGIAWFILYKNYKCNDCGHKFNFDANKKFSKIQQEKKREKA